MPRANPLKIPLSYLDNHTADCAEIWHAPRDPSANGFVLVKGGMYLHARTCHVLNPSQSHCYISTSTGPIVLKFGTHIEIHQLRGLGYSKEDAFAHAHVPRAQRLKKSPCYILTTTGPIALKFDMQLETKQLIRFLCARSLIAQKASYIIVLVI